MTRLIIILFCIVSLLLNSAFSTPISNKTIKQVSIASTIVDGHDTIPYKFKKMFVVIQTSAKQTAINEYSRWQKRYVAVMPIPHQPESGITLKQEKPLIIDNTITKALQLSSTALANNTTTINPNLINDSQTTPSQTYNTIENETYQLMPINHISHAAISNALATIIPPYLKENRFKLAFYYGNNPPLNQLKLYDNVVFEPSSGVDPKQFNTTNRQAYAYASLGEVVALNQYSKPLNPNWIIGENTAWKSNVVDQTRPDWQRFFLNEVITPLWNKGYRGFFLDTLDSYRLAAHNPKEIKNQQAGLIAIIKSIKVKYPDAKLILNRGFEILPDIHSLVNGVVVESLFGGWDNKHQRYFDVSDIDRGNILHELEKVKNLNIPITIVDYVAPNHQKKAYAIADKIAALNFNPWVTNGALTELYLYNAKILPRKILLFIQSPLDNVDERIGSDANRFIAMPLNYLGYATVIANINNPLPQHISNDEYAGIVMVLDGILLGREQALHDWYLKQIHNHIPLVIFNNFGFTIDSKTIKPFDLSLPSVISNAHDLKVVYQSPMIGYEFPVILKNDGFIPLILTDSTATSLLKVADGAGTKSDVAAITNWGGYIAGVGLIPEGINEKFHWSINPYQFLKDALKLPSLPIPDTTTENGRRLLLTHIDGDGFANKGEWFNGKYVGEIMSEEILKRYRLPTTVSIIQGEIAPNGINPKIASDLEQIARNIFALPTVELASHSFSHPFNWRKAAAYRGHWPNPNTLAIPNYVFNLDTEITGSVNYINDKLAPTNKKCKVFLWSGEGDIPEEALQLAGKLGIRNLNPGKIITLYNNSITNISALGLNQGSYFQIFAPMGNDFELQGTTTGRFFYSIINLIEAFKLTENPKRLKPIDIYLHFFPVAQKGGLKALHAVYDWALSQSIMPIYSSEYADKVVDFNNLVIAKQGNGWFIETNDALRELRVPITMGYPDLVRSKNIIGFNQHNDSYYIHLGPGGDSFLILSNTPPNVPYLVDANSRILQFKKDHNGMHFSLENYVLPKFILANVNNCTVLGSGEKILPTLKKDKQYHYELLKGKEYDVSIQCQ